MHHIDDTNQQLWALRATACEGPADCLGVKDLRADKDGLNTCCTRLCAADSQSCHVTQSTYKLNWMHCPSGLVQSLGLYYLVQNHTSVDVAQTDSML